MIEVFKTNVTSSRQATKILSAIHTDFDEYAANFDLQDCDNILRVASRSGVVETGKLKVYLEKLGLSVQVLE